MRTKNEFKIITDMYVINIYIYSEYSELLLFIYPYTVCTGEFANVSTHIHDLKLYGGGTGHNHRADAPINTNNLPRI